MHLSTFSNLLESILEDGDIKYVWLQFMTYTGDNLVRMIPILKFIEMVKRNQPLPVPKVLFNIIPNNHLSEGGTLTGSVYLKPDPLSFHRRPGSNQTRAVVLPWWLDKDGLPVEQCVRSRLQRLTNEILKESGCTMLVGFEVELILMKCVTDNDKIYYEPMNTDHSWSTMTPSDETLLDFLEEVVASLQDIGIGVEQFHAELAPGQWEFVLPPETPLKAVDNLVAARQTIKGIARQHGLHATFHPRPIPETAGNGGHVHLSLNADEKVEGNIKKIESFFAGILDHFISISAFTLPHDVSYERVTDGIAAGGTHISWGWDNRETILRRITGNRFEVKMVDGLGNPYLSLCALLAAGLHGLITDVPLTAGPCESAPCSLSVAEKAALGIQSMMPKSIDESLDSLAKNTVLPQYMGSAIVSTYIDVKRGELGELRKMTPDEF
ncbi:hypothetical protein PENSTE_c008G01755 [Penicillium steckii]|uniref:GS catalytic domain-containing protein n=1 Tax=Penicillium steckii TaxID=303698 RepID=A0A1V6TB39_9EURO|nr:hypothetical protein PENSTE_c008G01755 [Penicillium steckii]